MRSFLLFLLINSTVFGHGSELKYSVNDIPEDLKQNTYAVLREDLSEFKIVSANRSAEYIKTAITILTPNANNLAEFDVFYDRLTKIKFINASIYNARGELIKSTKQIRITDQSVYDGSLYSDCRVKHVDLSQNVYPYTAVIEYEIEFRFLFNIPDFVLFTDDKVGIEKKVFSVTFPAVFEPKYKLLGAKEPEITNDEQTRKLSWIYTNVKPPRWEKYSPPVHTYVPTVFIAPRDFGYDDYPGKMDTWENLGRWQLLLNKGRDVLPQSTIDQVVAMTAGKPDLEKVKILYQHLQKKTRYVSIQLGIGGFQPFEAKVVDQVSYGDCKALSNYMIAMLKAVGIKGYYAWVNAGDGTEPLPEFPSNFGNHIIVCVPMQKDTVWLECTSQYDPFNFLGKHTSDKYALLITETGGKLVRTPVHKKEKNLQITKATITVDKDGAGNAQASTKYTGLLYDYKSIGAYSKLGSDRQKDWIEHELNISSFSMKSFSIRTLSEEEPIAETTCDLLLPHAATLQGKRIVIQPNLLNKVTTVPDKQQSRNTDIFIATSHIELDTIEYTFTDAIQPESLPQPVKVSSPFGEYETHFIFLNNVLLYTRKFVVNNGTFPKEKYNDFVEFYRSVRKSDLMSVSFVAKD